MSDRKTQEGGRGFGKLALAGFHVEVSICKFLQHLLNVAEVFFFSAVEDHDVVQVDTDKIIKELA